MEIRRSHASSFDDSIQGDGSAFFNPSVKFTETQNYQQSAGDFGSPRSFSVQDVDDTAVLALTPTASPAVRPKNELPDPSESTLQPLVPKLTAEDIIARYIGYSGSGCTEEDAIKAILERVRIYFIFSSRTYQKTIESE